MSLSESTGVCSTNKSTPTANTDDFFEGAEKTLHFWFSANDDEDVSVNAKNDDNTNSANNVNNTEFAENATGKRQIGVSEWCPVKRRRHHDGSNPELSMAADSPAPVNFPAAAAAVSQCNEYGKILESAAAASGSGRDLRAVTRRTINEILQTINCNIMSHQKGKLMDAYILSESSLFVGRRELMLKTCGQTPLLKTLKPLLQLGVDCGFDADAATVVYSRKNYLRPEMQKPPQGNIQDEFQFLNDAFKGGKGFCFGNTTEKCWYLYSRLGGKTPQTVFNFQVLMTGINLQKTKPFMNLAGKTTNDILEVHDLRKLFPGLEIDDFLFEPHGYSMNGFSHNGDYASLHITPEPEFSYISFECNFHHHDSILKDLIEYFTPLKATVVAVTLEKTDNSEAAKDASVNHIPFLELQDYQAEILQTLKFDHLHVNYALYQHVPRS